MLVVLRYLVRCRRERTDGCGVAAAACMLVAAACGVVAAACMLVAAACGVTAAACIVVAAACGVVAAACMVVAATCGVAAAACGVPAAACMVVAGACWVFPLRRMIMIVSCAYRRVCGRTNCSPGEPYKHSYIHRRKGQPGNYRRVYDFVSIYKRNGVED